MKKSVVAVCLCLAATLVGAEECSPASAYKVRAVTFSKVTLDTGLRMILKGTPLMAKVAPSASSTTVGAEGVAGPLDQVLDDLMASTSNKWVQAGCQISVTGNAPLVVKEVAAPAVAMLPVWKIRGGDSLNDVIHRWAEPAGWQVIWSIDETDVLRLMADATFTGTLEEAVEALSEAMANSGETMRFVFHHGNKVLRISRTQ